jgi:oxygen-independent coproporphyrinogen-3 oxidase
MRASRGVDGLYVHVPFCDGKCAYCAFYSVPFAPAAAARYVEALETELRHQLRELGPIAPETIYFGGGTPTLLPPPLLRRLCGRVRGAIVPERLAEWSVEANPGTLTAESLRVLLDAGVNRVSLGVQSFDDATLRRLGRRHTAADARAAVALLRAAGVRNWGLDLIACVPGLGRAGWRRTLDEAVALGPAHVSVYALTAEEGSALAQRVAAGGARLLSDDEQLAHLHLAERRLAAAGYARYEISNYARPGFECRHNVACWQGADYLGLGPAAASRVGDRRWTNRADLAAYSRALAAGRLPPREEERATPHVQVAERLIFGLRWAGGVDVSAAAAAAGLADDPSAARWEHALRTLRRQGLVRRRAGTWRLTRRGRDLADHVGVEVLGAV